MIKTEQGFSVIEALIIVVIIGIIGGVGYSVQHHKRSVASVDTGTKTSTQVSTAPQAAPTGTTQAIDNITAQDASSESSIDSKHSNNDQSTAQNANTAAENVGGAYNESAF